MLVVGTKLITYRVSSGRDRQFKPLWAGAIGLGRSGAGLVIGRDRGYSKQLSELTCTRGES